MNDDGFAIKWALSWLAVALLLLWLFGAPGWAIVGALLLSGAVVPVVLLDL